MQSMRSGWKAVLLACLLAPALPALAQDGMTLEDAKKAYQDTLAQLKAAQDRKSELNTQNEKLNARVAELEKQLEVAKRESSEVADKTFLLRARNAAWETFMKQYPDLMQRWKVWLENDAGFKAGTLPAGIEDRDWPFEIKAEG